MTALKPYPAYTDVGVEWLGNVPSHWECLPNRALFAEVINKNHPDEQMLSVTIARGVITQSELLEDSSKKDSSNLDKTSYKLVHPGDLAYNKMRAWQGAVGVSDYRGIVSPAYIIMRPKRGQEPRYLHYLFRTPAFATEAERWSYGITSDQWSLRSEDFKQIYSLNPPLDEQRAIANFLDGMDARITRFIAARRKMIALLEEKKQAVINQAVTRGLDPDVPMRDSGVNWLGEIPAHWEVQRLRRVARLAASNVDKLSLPNESSVRLCNYTDVYKNYLITDDLNFMRATATDDEISRFSLHGGEVIFTKDSESFDDIGIPAVADYGLENVVVGYHLMVAWPGDALSGYYLAWFFTPQRNRWQFEVSAKGVTRFGMPQSGFKDAVITVPPTEEQRAIVDFVDRETKRLDVLASRYRREMDLIKDYRTRLISDVVTGKLDVREVELPVVEEVIGEEIEAAMEEVRAEMESAMSGENG